MKKFLVVALIAIGALWLMGQGARAVLFSTIFNRPTQGEEVSMLQPNGIFLGRDQAASEINVNNSTANKNNGEYIESVANAQYTEALAEDTKEAYTSNGIFLGGLGGCLLGAIVVFGAIIGVFALFVALARRSENNDVTISKR